MSTHDVLLTFFKSLADANRLRIVGLLAHRPHTVEELAEVLALRPSTVSHHLSRLSAAELVSATVQGHSGDVAHWLNTEGPNALEGCPACKVDEGSSVWVPAGSHPIATGVSQPLQKITQKVDLKERTIGQAKHHCALAVLPLFDMEGIRQYDPDIRREMSASWVRASAHLLQTWVGLAGIQAWRAALAPTPATSAAVQAA